MHCGCKRGWHMLHAHMQGPMAGGPRMFRVFPFVMIVPLSIAVSSVIGVCLTVRIAKALETMAAAKALRELEGRLSDGERATLEGRIRDNLFSKP